MLSDYKKEEKILDKLEELKELKIAEESYNPIERGAENLVKDCLEQKETLSPELLDVFQKMLSKYSYNEVFQIAKTIIDASKEYITEANSTVNGIKKSITEVRKEIGDIMLDDASKTGVTERSHHFHGFGNVKCTLKEIPVIMDENIVKTELAKDPSYLCYLKIEKKDLLKNNDCKKIPGIEMEDKITVTIKSDTK